MNSLITSISKATLITIALVGLSLALATAFGYNKNKPSTIQSENNFKSYRSINKDGTERIIKLTMYGPAQYGMRGPGGPGFRPGPRGARGEGPGFGPHGGFRQGPPRGFDHGPGMMMGGPGGRHGQRPF